MDEATNMGPLALQSRLLESQSGKTSTLRWLMVGLVFLLSTTSVFTIASPIRADGCDHTGYKCKRISGKTILPHLATRAQPATANG